MEKKHSIGRRGFAFLAIVMTVGSLFMVVTAYHQQVKIDRQECQIHDLEIRSFNMEMQIADQYINYRDNISSTVQAAKADASYYTELEPGQKSIKIDGFKGVVLWLSGPLPISGNTPYLPDANSPIVVSYGQHEIPVPERATGYLQKGVFTDP